jgi:hypothetical protein
LWPWIRPGCIDVSSHIIVVHFLTDIGSVGHLIFTCYPLCQFVFCDLSRYEPCGRVRFASDLPVWQFQSEVEHAFRLFMDSRPKAEVLNGFGASGIRMARNGFKGRCTPFWMIILSWASPPDWMVVGVRPGQRQHPGSVDGRSTQKGVDLAWLGWTVGRGCTVCHKNIFKHCVFLWCVMGYILIDNAWWNKNYLPRCDDLMRGIISPYTFVSSSHRLFRQAESSPALGIFSQKPTLRHCRVDQLFELCGEASLHSFSTCLFDVASYSCAAFIAGYSKCGGDASLQSFQQGPVRSQQVAISDLVAHIFYL